MSKINLQSKAPKVKLATLQTAEQKLIYAEAVQELCLYLDVDRDKLTVILNFLGTGQNVMLPRELQNSQLAKLTLAQLGKLSDSAMLLVGNPQPKLGKILAALVKAQSESEDNAGRYFQAKPASAEIKAANLGSNTTITPAPSHQNSLFYHDKPKKT